MAECTDTTVAWWKVCILGGNSYIKIALIITQTFKILVGLVGTNNNNVN
jgi:hypothetical protein